MGLKFDCRTKVRNLSVAESQMTEIAKCLTIGARGYHHGRANGCPDRRGDSYSV